MFSEYINNRMNSSKIIFLGGIHGVGKGTLSKKLISELNLEYLSASKLLRWDRVSNDIQNKKVSNISKTQERLLNALKEKCEQNKQYILDGHFCLFNAKGVVEKISFDTFAKINPRIIAVITTNEKIIKQRLEKRDEKIYDIKLLKKMQKIEKDYAVEIASILKIPFFEIKDGNQNDFINLISNLN